MAGWRLFCSLGGGQKILLISHLVVRQGKQPDAGEHGVEATICSPEKEKKRIEEGQREGSVKNTRILLNRVTPSPSGRAREKRGPQTKKTPTIMEEKTPYEHPREK